MPKGDMATKKKVRSGQNIPEGQRGTIAIKLRLPPDVAETLKALADERGLGQSELVTELVREAEGRGE